MSASFFIMIGMFVGSTIGGFIPGLFGAGILSFTGILGSGIGGILGIIFGFKIWKMVFD